MKTGLLALLLIITSDVDAETSGWRRRLPQALIIGSKKSGTRALLAFSSLHPDVRTAGPEVHYFDRHYHRGLQWYRRRMPASLPNQLTLEKTPAYFVDPRVPSRVRRMSPTTKLVLLVRDPATRALSDYAQAADKAARRGRPQPAPFEQLAFVHQPDGNLTVNADWSPVRIGRYHEHLARWLEQFPRRQILVLSAEHLVQDPGAVMIRLQRFLGLPVLVTKRHFYWDRRKGFHCLRTLQPLESPRFGRTPRRRRRRRCLASDKGRRHPRVPWERLHHLRSYFRPYNQRFYSLVGENFHWDQT